jgi:hypothetical protein
VVLCVDQVEDGSLSGRMYHGYSTEAVEIRELDQLLFELERFFDSINFPYPSTNERKFLKEETRRERIETKVKKVSDEELLKKHGDIGTFIIRVQHRQNSSWQGRITWMDKDKTISFRSVWEMIKLIASALDTVSGQEENEEEKGWPEA